jgi:hypothetical protein
MKNAVFWDVTPCCSCKNRHFRETYRLQLLVTVSAVPSSLILFTLLIEAILSYETSVLTRATRHHIPEDGILHRLHYSRSSVMYGPTVLSQARAHAHARTHTHTHMHTRTHSLGINLRFHIPMLIECRHYFDVFAIVTAVTKCVVFWVITLCSSLKVSQYIGGIFRFHLHGRARYEIENRAVNVFLRNVG